MAATTFIFPIFLLVALAATVGIIFLQIYLSRRESKILGLILPGITLILSLVFVLSFSAYSFVSTSGTAEVIEFDENGEVIEQHSYPDSETVIEGPEFSVDFGDVLALSFAFLLLNIPTLVLLAIYFGCRKNLHRDKQLQKMAIQDL